MGQLIAKFLSHVLPGVVRPLHALWNEVIGFLFLCFAVLFGFKAVRTYMDLNSGPPEEATGHLVRLCMTIFCTLLMLYFGVTSFLRARKISRS